MIVREWQLGDNERLLLQPSQEYLRDWVIGLDFSGMDAIWVAEDDEGDVIFIGGVVPMWQGRAAVWSLVSTYAGSDMLRIHRKVRQKLNDFNEKYRRLEMTVDVGFTQGHRWAKMLGFEVEGYMRAYRPDGGDMLMYSRIR